LRISFSSFGQSMAGIRKTLECPEALDTATGGTSWMEVVSVTQPPEHAQRSGSLGCCFSA
jgi:hypothetical protein